MAETILDIRIRPQRIAILLPWQAEPKQALTAIHMLTVIWGGRYCPIIPVGETSEQIDLAQEWLTQLSPDFLYGIDVDHELWEDLATECCRPLAYYRVGKDPLDVLLRFSPPGLISIDPLYARILRQHPGLDNWPLFYPCVDRDTCIAVAAAATFGYMPRDDAKHAVEALKGEFSEIDPTACAQTLLSLSMPEDRLSLLDVGSDGLQGYIISGPLGIFGLAPTIVLFNDVGASLSLYWVLRMQEDAMRMQNVLLFPQDAIRDTATLQLLTDWIRQRSARSNYCRIVTFDGSPDAANALARRLRARLASCCRVRHVDVGYGNWTPPVVLPSEQLCGHPTTKLGNEYTFSVPSPTLVDSLGTRDYWMLDLRRDRKNGRGPAESFAPQFHSIGHEVLNAPVPPRVSASPIDPLRYGRDGVSIRLNRDKDVETVYLPSGCELLGEYFKQRGFSAVPDEKRPLYESVIDIFGSVSEAASSCTGVSLRMLLRLAKRETTLDQIRKIARCGTSPADDSGPRWPMTLLKDKPIRVAVGEERFKGRARSSHPWAAYPQDALAHWVEKGIATQAFELPRCPKCRDTSWVHAIDLSARVLCPGCGSNLRVQNPLKIGYRLEALVAKALDEGFAPIVLTARYLRNQTSSGFQMIPGYKFRWKEEDRDIDIAALCDGLLVLAECKNMADVKLRAKSWDQVAEQLGKLIEIGQHCSAGIVILASFADRYPRKIRDLAKSATTETMAVHLLRRQHLERGLRVESPGPPYMSGIDWFLPRCKRKREVWLKGPGTREESL